MLCTVKEPQRLIRPDDGEIAAAVRLLTRAIQTEGDARCKSARTPAAEDRAAARAGAMVDRLARVAEYVEFTPLQSSRPR